ncbi:GTP cyclohydrolase I [Hyphomonas oceanitis]|uniref:GTP cyclohydrolase I n=1 Tax=Hyphomonas oceanitis TaxID=81033 RepID=UPI003AB950BB|tara:strand:- start:3373 stop:4077 length:705 start_codon:yes stop_codon:yes gene_type:complete
MRVPNRTPTPATASARVRERLEAADHRYFANDNISAFLEPGDLDAIKADVEAAVDRVLDSLVIDTARDHNTRETAQRVARMYLSEVFSGRYLPAPEATEFPNAEGLNELMIVGPITIRSACSHHLCPIIGRVWIGILPNARSNLIGLSKYARLTDWIMSRPQIQEEAIVQLADLLETLITPDGIAIVMEADHFCMHWRGVKDDNTQMINSVMRGQFLDNASLRREFLTLIRLRQ